MWEGMPKLKVWVQCYGELDKGLNPLSPYPLYLLFYKLFKSDKPI